MNFKFSKRDVVKYAVGAVVGYGVNEIVRNIVDNNIQTEPKKIARRLAVYAGRAAIMGILSKVAKNHTDSLVDSVFDHVETAFDEIKNNFSQNSI